MPLENLKRHPEHNDNAINTLLNFNTLNGLIKEGELQYIEPSTLWALMQIESWWKLDAINTDSYWLVQITPIAIKDIKQFRNQLPKNLIRQIETILNITGDSWDDLINHPENLTQIDNKSYRSLTNLTLLSVLLSIAYLKLIESRYLRSERQRFGELENLRNFSSSQEVINFLKSRKNLKGEFNVKILNDLIDEIINNEELYNRFLTLWRYNGGETIIDNQLGIKYKHVYALWVLYYEKTTERIVNTSSIDVLDETKKAANQLSLESIRNLKKLQTKAQKAKYVTLAQPTYIYTFDDKLVNLWLRAKGRTFEIDNNKGQPIVQMWGHIFLKVKSYDGKSYLLEISKKNILWENLSFSNEVQHNNPEFLSSFANLLNWEDTITLLSKATIYREQNGRFISLGTRPMGRKFLLPPEVKLKFHPLTDKIMLQVISLHNHKNYRVDIGTPTNLKVIWTNLYDKLKALAESKQFDTQAAWSIEDLLMFNSRTTDRKSISF